ncbi:MAG: exo-alpha-sialidase [Candidatus Altiarchaeota archaeon]|nr:exo-alpha-sialidase [Candidatus Altiarchaeota archaeon]
MAKNWAHGGKIQRVRLKRGAAIILGGVALFLILAINPIINKPEPTKMWGEESITGVKLGNAAYSSAEPISPNRLLMIHTSTFGDMSTNLRQVYLTAIMPETVCINWDGANPCSYAYDENWITYAIANISLGYYYVNYSKREAKDCIWSVKSDCGRENITLPNACKFLDPLRFRVTSDRIGGVTDWACYDGSSWKTLMDCSAGARVYEEAIWWLVDSPTNAWKYQESTGEEEIFVSPHTEILNTGRHHHCNGLARLANGDFIVIFQNSTAHHAGSAVVSMMRTSDNGSTWSTPRVILDELPVQHLCPSVGVAPNGTLVVFSRVLDRFNITEGLKYSKSYDDGVSWTDPQWLNETAHGQEKYISSDILTKDGVMYAALYDGGEEEGNFSAHLWVSTDNGESWHKRSTMYQVGELGEYAGYFTVVFRKDGSLLMTTEQDRNSTVVYKISNDDGYTWGGIGFASLSNASHHVADPDIDMLGNWYILHGRDRNISIESDMDFTVFYLSKNGQVWGDYTRIEENATYPAVYYGKLGG